MIKKSSFFLIMTCSILWPLSIFYNWSSDFGIYYSMGNLIDNDYRLYKESWDTKGPVYFFFLKVIGEIIGKGVWQSYISLIVTTLFYLVSLFFVINKFVKNDLAKLFLVILSIASLNFQNATSSIAIFQSSLYIFSYYFLIRSIETKNSYLFLLSTILLSAAILTRIDAIVYSFVFFFAFIILLKGSKSKLKFILLLIAFNFLLVFFFFSFYGFNITEFYQANIDHYRQFAVPSNIKTKIYILIYRTDQLIELSLQGILPSFILILGIIFFNKFYKKIDLKNNIIIFSLVFFGVIFSIYSESPSYRHANIFVTPILFLIIYYLGKIQIKNKFVLILPGLLFLIISLVFYTMTIKKVFLSDCYKNIFCENSNYKQSKKTIEEVNKLKNVDVIGSNGWIYVFTDAKPNLSIVNWNLYFNANFYPTEYTINQHNDLISRKRGSNLWINKLILNNPNPTIYLNEVINHYQFVEDQGLFFKYKKK